LHLSIRGEDLQRGKKGDRQIMLLDGHAMAVVNTNPTIATRRKIWPQGVLSSVRLAENLEAFDRGRMAVEKR